MFDDLERLQVGEVYLFCHRESRLRAVIAIHSTRLGPALGGCRFIPYRSDRDALCDALRLARGMSYKAALAGLPLGGGKAVVLRPAELPDRAALFEHLGRCIENLSGRYITSVDAGTDGQDMDAVARSTRWVVGTTAQRCDPSPYTALGVFEGIKAAVRCRWPGAVLSGKRVAVQGLGHVGMELACRLREAGAELLVSDLDPARARRAGATLQAEVVAPGAIIGADCDVLAPCALGGVINRTTLPSLRCGVVAGCANNQLKDRDCGLELYRRGILYAPDFVINAGGLIRVSVAHAHISEVEARGRTVAIGSTLEYVFEQSRRHALPPEDLAERRAELIIQQGGLGDAQACRAI